MTVNFNENPPENLNKFTIFYSQNKLLRTALESSEQDIREARNSDELAKAIQPLAAFGENIRFHPQIPLFFVALGLLLLVLGILGAGRIAGIGNLIIVGAVIAFFGFRRFRKNRKIIPNLTQLALRRLRLLSNGLLEPDESHEHIYGQLLNDFSDYDRGNHSRDLHHVLDGQIDIQGEKRPLRYVHFHYVNQRKETYTDRGELKTRIVYEHFDRYSLVVPDCSLRNVSAFSDRTKALKGQVRWDTSLDSFNRRFTLSGGSEMECAKFARPSIILHVEKMAQDLAGLNIEYGYDGSLCVAFDNADLLSFADPGITLHQPAQFLALIEEGIALPRLDHVLGLVGELAHKS